MNKSAHSSNPGRDDLISGAAKGFVPDWSRVFVLQAEKWLRQERRVVPTMLVASFSESAICAIVQSAGRDRVRSYRTIRAIGGWGAWSSPRPLRLHAEQSPDGLLRLESLTCAQRTIWLHPEDLVAQRNEQCGAVRVGSAAFVRRTNFVEMLAQHDEAIRNRWDKATGREWPPRSR